MKKAYITGSSIICALGNNKLESINKIKNLSDDNYKEYRNKVFKTKNFYFIDNLEDKQTRFFRIIKQAIYNALDDANIAPNEYSQLSVYIGSTSMNISLIEDIYISTDNFNPTLNSQIIDYITKLLDLKKSSIIFSTACTSSANALIHASNEIKNNQITKALILGLEFYNDLTYGGFESLMLLSPSGEYRPLSKQSDGLILGEGCSAIILENKEKVPNSFYVLGSQNLFDNYSQTSSNPNGEIIYQTMINAIENSNLYIEDITLVNTHSPGTDTSNTAELNALRKLLTNKTTVTSMKPYIGHTLGACSINEITLLISCLKDNFIPNTLGSTDNDNIIFSTYTKYDKSSTILFSYNGFSGNNISFILSNKD